MVAMRYKLSGILTVLSLAGLAAAQQHRVQSVDVKVLSTMLADSAGIGEWGFSALVVADGHRILFDTGARSDTVLNNVRELN
jgi:7,8-dihydropterin-6-yl-methyl-4-(beta-D-ribofuranosyl)aminobenzene 5'-phosphate synthase